MARIPREELDAIVQRDMPGYEVVHTQAARDAAGAAPVPADQSAADIDALRRKFLGDEPDAGGAARDAAAARAAPAGDDDELVVVKPEGAGLAPAKRVVVSGATRRIIGSQG